ncbi:MAG TPA: hypothetical protein VLF68_01255 [Candidatus Saccharimonadales bacterium]|nr:hypothetical protein [Candidatus Saccharimonadales bacterium]
MNEKFRNLAILGIGTALAFGAAHANSVEAACDPLPRSGDGYASPLRRLSEDPNVLCPAETPQAAPAPVQNEPAPIKCSGFTITLQTLENGTLIAKAGPERCEW